MRFGLLPLAEVAGAEVILAHTLRVGGAVLKKGRRLDADDVRLLAAAGVTEVMAARLGDGDVGEDAVAARVAAALAGAGVRVAAAKTGRANLYATTAGLVHVDAARIDALNLVDEAVTAATLAPLAVVQPGTMVATVKVIPFAVPAATVARCVEAGVGAAEPGGAGGAACAVRAFRPLRVALVLTRLEGQPEARLEQGARAVGDRVRAIGSTLVAEVRCAHDIAAVTRALGDVLALEVDLVLLLGASAIVDRQDVIPAAVERAGGHIDHFGMPVDPGNLILVARSAERGGVAILGVPSCARSLKRSGFDMLLERFAAGLPCGRDEVMRMGVGGLLPEIASRPGPREEGAAMTTTTTESERPRIAALVLAAGSSRRMGPTNKLLVPIDGRPMVVRAVDAVQGAASAAAIGEVVVVTGHEAERVRAALAERAGAAGARLRFVHNDAHATGLASSLKAGVAALGAEVDGVLVCLGDMPWLRASTLTALVAAGARGDGEGGDGVGIAVPTIEGKRGNPVVWGRRYFGEILALDGDMGAKELLARHRDEVAWVEVDDPGILLDVDTEDALRALVPGAAI
ncbi:MAG: NTP transferase domain-containing protein [Myxococcota bacterium]